MKPDRELLELAAKASGRNVIWKLGMHRGEPHEGLFDLSTGHVTSWNPLTDDGDALRLAVRLNIHVLRFESMTTARPVLSSWGCDERDDGDAFAATRRAIVRAAAAVGEAMQ